MLSRGHVVQQRAKHVEAARVLAQLPGVAVQRDTHHPVHVRLPLLRNSVMAHSKEGHWWSSVGACTCCCGLTALPPAAAPALEGAASSPRCPGARCRCCGKGSVGGWRRWGEARPAAVCWRARPAAGAANAGAGDVQRQLHQAMRSGGRPLTSLHCEPPAWPGPAAGAAGASGTGRPAAGGGARRQARAPGMAAERGRLGRRGGAGASACSRAGAAPRCPPRSPANLSARQRVSLT